MQQPSTQVDTEFAQFLQGLPADWETRMRELGAFTYAGKIQSPPELLRAIFLYCGPDQSLREVAGTLTLRAERITDQAIWKRLHRCTPFLITLLKQMLSLEELPALPSHLRFLACDGTPGECPGATSADDRLHLTINLSASPISRGSHRQYQERREPEELSPLLGRCGGGRSRVWLVCGHSRYRLYAEGGRSLSAGIISCRCLSRRRKAER